MASQSGQMILFKGGHVLTLDKTLGDFEIADVLVSGSKIAEIGPNLQVSGAIVIDATDTIDAGKFLAPACVIDPVTAAAEAGTYHDEIEVRRCHTYASD